MSSTSAWTRSGAAVVDASAIVSLITDDVAAAGLRDRLSGHLIHAPAIIDLEVLHALRGGILRKALDTATAEAAIETYSTLTIVRFAHDPLFYRIWQLRDNLTAYDAAYVALAEGLKVPLITLDARLAKSAPPSCRVELFA